MQKVIAHDYKDVYTTHLTVYANGACEKNSSWSCRTRETINKVAYYYPECTWDLVSELSQETSQVNFSGTKLFVASESKTCRDTFRNSNYSITRDKDKADAIVVPDVIPHLYARFSCNLVAYDDSNERLHLVHVEKYGYQGRDEDLTEYDLQVAKSFLQTTMILTVDPTTVKNLTVWFLPKCEEMADVILGNKLQKPYVQESKVPLSNTPTKISPETLVFWENIADPNLLVRAICSSDWMKYPRTVLALLAGFRKDVENWYTQANSDFRRILNVIDYSAWYGNKGFLDGRDITPKDYAMLQSYVLYRFGVDENGGFLNGAQWRSIPVCVRKILQTRMFIKPYSIPSKMNCNNLMSLMEK